MKRPVSAPIDRVHGLVKARKRRAEALIEKAEDGPPGLWVWRKAADPQDSRCQFEKAYDDFVDGLDTMKAARNDLENQGYEDCDFVFLDAARKEYFHVAGIQACYVALVKARHSFLTGIPGGIASLLDSLRPLEQALLKARAFARKSLKRKTAKRRRAGKPRKPRPLTPRQTEVIQIVGECKGNIAAAARRFGRDRKTIEEIYRAGMTKLGKTVYHSKDKTRLLARDRRGQETVSEDDDRRR